MTTTVWPNGLGGATGDTLGTCKPLITSGSVFYVDSVTGSPEYDGTDEARPKSKLTDAVTLATGNDIVVLLPTHNEVITAQITVGTGITILGLGSAGGKPTAKLTRGYDGSIFSMSGSSSALRNIYFPASTVASATPHVVTSDSGINISDCYFEMGANDQHSALYLNTSTQDFRLTDTSFVSTAAATGDQPFTTVRLGAALSHIYLIGVTVDGGASGWGSPYGLDLGTFAITILRAESLSLLRGSDMHVTSTTTGYVNVQTATGSSRVLW